MKNLIKEKLKVAGPMDLEQLASAVGLSSNQVMTELLDLMVAAEVISVNGAYEAT